MTDDQQRLADQLLAVLDQDDRIESVWLSGSLGRGAGDAWSDLDLTLTVAEKDIPSCLAGRLEAEWPATFESATRSHLRATLAFELP